VPLSLKLERPRGSMSERARIVISESTRLSFTLAVEVEPSSFLAMGLCLWNAVA
jgi:hypothetical protein